ncbi:butyrophilin subfamily 1 member A1-like isoform X2 [Mauremys reevesii]|uniref:butyrophilin subfamily 1 member A1-like isoform X2 n=1 Tax=Mauremys reevesii TaxID=260615 RepID=UPI00193EEF21|nr:butyrophilin subfamily 1 member A1-like isoform X2 [Mauremys reevesii]
MQMRISFHSHCAMGNPCLSSYLIFFFTVHVSTLEPVNFQVIGPDHPIMVSAGEDALLPCHLSPKMNAQKMEVRWYRSQFSEPVHLYQDEKDQAEQQIPNYQGRTELLKDGIVNGSVVLRIRSITPSDHGQFICFFKSSSFYAEAILELKVAGLGSTPRIAVDSYQSGGIHMVCESAGWYPEPQAQWRDLSGQHLPSLTEKITPHDNGLFEAQISIIVTETSSQDLSCSVRNSHLNPGKESVVYIADPFFLRGYPFKVAMYILLVVVGLLISTASYFFWKQHKAKEAHAAEREAHAAERGKLVADLEKLQVKLVNLEDELKWRKTQIYGVKVTLDPDTAHRRLKLSEDQKTVTLESKHQDLPDKPERFDEVFCVLGSDGFISGKIYWEVERLGTIWAIGVARESVRRKGEIKFTPEEGIWGIEKSRSHYLLLATPESPLPLSETPKKIRIYVDYEKGEVIFFNPDNADLITCLTASFNGQRIFPFFWVCSHLTLTT